MRVIKLNKSADVAQAIQTIRDLKDDEVVFELTKDSPILKNSTNLKLIKKTGEVLGKTVRIRTDDPTGRLLALKAEILEGGPTKTQKPAHAINKVKRSDVNRRFSDIMRKPGMHKPVPAKSLAAMTAIKPSAAKPPLAKPQAIPAQAVQPKIKSRSSFSKIFVVSMVVLVLVVFALSVLLPTATITVYARSEPISRDVEITVDKSATGVDASKMVVPAITVSREVTQTKNFPTTGTKIVGTKATGSVTLYNFTKNTLTLKASTTVLLAGSKKFVFSKDVTGLRPTARIGTGTDEEIDQTSLIPPVPVIAMDVGADSNLPAGTKLSLQNAALGNTTNVLAANDQAFTGGTSKNIQVLSQADIDKAVADLSGTIALQTQTDLNSETSPADLLVLPQGITAEVLAKTANKNVGDEAADFDMTMIAKATGLAFHQGDLKNIILSQIQSVLSNDKYLLPDAQEKLSASFKTVDLKAGKGAVSVHYETTAAYKVNAKDMSKQLAGKSATQIKEILLAKPEIDRVDVEFKPFFVNKAPRLNGKIYIQTLLSQGG